MIQRTDPQHERPEPAGASSPAGAGPTGVPRQDEGEGAVPDALANAIAHACDIAENMRLLLVLRTERRRILVRKGILRGIALALVALALVPLVVGATSRLIAGMAAGLTSSFGGRAWLGDLCTGVLVLGGLAVLVALVSWQLSRKGLQRKVAAYGDPGS